MEALELIKLPPLMELTGGRPEVAVALIDGPVLGDHPNLAGASISQLADGAGAYCTAPDSTACQHGTFVAGILVAQRGSPAPAICPGCPLLVRPIFTEASGGMPAADADELAAAIVDSIAAGARIINLSAAIARPSSKAEQALTAALDLAAQRGVILVAASGNQGLLGSTAITRHPWVIPTAAYDMQGRPMAYSNLGASIGRRGIGAPGDRITSLGPDGTTTTMGGTSAAVPFVTGSLALLWSHYPDSTATDVKLAVTQSAVGRRNTVVPPLLDAWAAYLLLTTMRTGRRRA